MLVREALYQVYVDDNSSGLRVAVGPRVASAVAAEFCAAIQREIKAGREKSWSNPGVQLVKHIQ